MFFVFFNKNAKGQIVMTFPEEKHNGYITDMSIDTTNNILISVSNDKTLRIWEYYKNNFILQKIIDMPFDFGENGQLTKCILDPKGRYAITSGKTGISSLKKFLTMIIFALKKLINTMLMI